ncbi:hypothetical protein EV426DRAFT_718243 [Tirmania nivea]|nr:hypothetical protein EV426DRAFT_718243 [Tirmania nivea]
MVKDGGKEIIVDLAETFFANLDLPLSVRVERKPQEIGRRWSNWEEMDERKKRAKKVNGGGEVYMVDLVETFFSNLDLLERKTATLKPAQRRKEIPYLMLLFLPAGSQWLQMADRGVEFRRNKMKMQQDEGKGGLR